MEEMIKQKETFDTKQEGHITQRVVGIIFGVIEVALAFRLVFKLLGANPQNGFVQGIYTFTQLFAGFFEGIFSRVTKSGAETTAVLEPATLIAMVVIGVIAWFVMKLIAPRIGNRVERTEFRENAK
jgi:hypothetical protein